MQKQSENFQQNEKTTTNTPLIQIARLYLYD